MISETKMWVGLFIRRVPTIYFILWYGWMKRLWRIHRMYD